MMQWASRSQSNRRVHLDLAVEPTLHPDRGLLPSQTHHPPPPTDPTRQQRFGRICAYGTAAQLHPPNRTKAQRRQGTRAGTRTGGAAGHPAALSAAIAPAYRYSAKGGDEGGWIDGEVQRF